MGRVISCLGPSRRHATRARGKGLASSAGGSLICPVNPTPTLGRSGLQMTSRESVPGCMGFSPPPNPKLIASYATRGPAIALTRGLDRDWVVDESGNKTVVFGRCGSRPVTAPEFDAFLRRYGKLCQVEDVTTRDGALFTASGHALCPTNTFVPEAGRLTRRPPD